MKLSEAKSRREAITMRELEITSELAEMKRLWIADGVTTSFAARTTLEAELALLGLEKTILSRKLEATKAATKTFRHTLSHAMLIKLVTERGMPELVIEADRLALDATIGEVG